MKQPETPNSLKRAREIANLTQEQLAARISVTRAAVSQWETGDTSPAGPSRRMLALALDLPMDVVDGWFSRDDRERVPA